MQPRISRASPTKVGATRADATAVERHPDKIHEKITSDQNPRNATEPSKLRGKTRISGTMKSAEVNKTSDPRFSLDVAEPACNRQWRHFTKQAGRCKCTCDTSWPITFRSKNRMHFWRPGTCKAGCWARRSLRRCCGPCPLTASPVALDH